MKAWFRTTVVLGLEFALPLIFSGYAIFAAETSVYTPKTLTHDDLSVTESKTPKPGSPASAYGADGLVFIPNTRGYLVSAVRGPTSSSDGKRSYNFIVDDSFSIPNIQGP